jgi:hypothetical protein
MSDTTTNLSTTNKDFQPFRLKITLMHGDNVYKYSYAVIYYLIILL